LPQRGVGYASNAAPSPPNGRAITAMETAKTPPVPARAGSGRAALHLILSGAIAAKKTLGGFLPATTKR
jgi:hypothetical protein